MERKVKLCHEIIGSIVDPGENFLLTSQIHVSPTIMYLHNMYHVCYVYATPAHSLVLSINRPQSVLNYFKT